MKKYKIQAFTLVELIIVIFILTILSGLAFLSFRSYTLHARDSSRIATLKEIESALITQKTTQGKYPIPDELYATGNILGKDITQIGKIGKDVSRFLKITKTPYDPLNGEKYLYGISSDNKYFQIAGILENGSISYIDSAYADTASARARVLGNYNGVIQFSTGSKTYLANMPSILFSRSGSVNLLSEESYFIIDKGENLPYLVQGNTQNQVTKDQVLEQLTGTQATLTGVELTQFSTQSVQLTQTLGLPLDVIGKEVYGNDYYLKKSTMSMATPSGGGGWSIASGGDCQYVDNALGNEGDTASCLDSRTYTHVAPGATHSRNYNLIKMNGHWWFNQNLAYPLPADKFVTQGNWPQGSDFLSGKYGCVGDDTTCAQVSSVGYLYQQTAAVGGDVTSDDAAARITGICPSGWAIPVFKDFFIDYDAYTHLVIPPAYHFDFYKRYYNGMSDITLTDNFSAWSSTTDKIGWPTSYLPNPPSLSTTVGALWASSTTTGNFGTMGEQKIYGNPVRCIKN